MTPDIVKSISERYIELYEQITGETFVKPTGENVVGRVENAINYALTAL
jgi:phosphoribosylaminoimidazole-succinocarboxamide synthase